MPRNFQSGLIEFNGILKGRQKTSFHCPFFMRSSQTNFQHNFYPSEIKNSTKLRDFDTKIIRENLKKNPGYFEYKNEEMNWNYQAMPMNRIKIDLNMDIEEVELRFRTTFWQKISMIWTQYVAVLLVFIFIMDKLKAFMFRSQFLCAWENIPWKKNY